MWRSKTNLLVVGFNWPPVGHDNAVAAIVDGKLIFASEEERHSRHKHSPEEPPIQSMLKLARHLKSQGINIKDVDAWAINLDPAGLSLRDRLGGFSHALSKMPPSHYSNREAIKILRYAVAGFDYTKLVKYFLAKVFGALNTSLNEKIRVYAVEHHLAHAASAFYFSGLNSAVCLTIDGVGEQDSTVIWRAKGDDLQKLLSMHASYASLGILFDAAGQKVGWDVLEGAGKLMGLAPYGNNSNIYINLKRACHISEGGDLPYYISLSNCPIKKHKLYVYELFDKIFPNKVSWNPRGELNADAANLAWAVQQVCEEAILSTARWAKDNSGESNLVLAGGVALNAKANMALHYSKLFNNIFIFPAANDAGGPVGAAAYVYEHILGQKMKSERLRNVYLGPDYHDEVEKVVKQSKWNSQYVGDDTTEVARMVADGKILTWYQGRAELGPRALGNRSIVADPRRKEIWKILNQIKGREWWRPLAPSLLSEDSREYFEDPVDHEFMILMFKFKEEAKARVPGVVHVDGTARPQTVTADQNKRWYDLIKSFKEITGEGLIINTSFNLAGEPLVETPYDALRSFSIGGFDAIYLDGWIIKKY